MTLAELTICEHFNIGLCETKIGAFHRRDNSREMILTEVLLAISPKPSTEPLPWEAAKKLH
jgi:hypothetical protein